jgi:hypothetical protein
VGVPIAGNTSVIVPPRNPPETEAQPTAAGFSNPIDARGGNRISEPSDRTFLNRIASVEAEREIEGLCHSRTSESRQKRSLQSRSASGLAKKSKSVYLSSPHYCHVLENNRAWRGEGRKE